MPIDPETGLETDEAGNILPPEATGSDRLDSEIDAQLTSELEGIAHDPGWNEYLDAPAPSWSPSPLGPGAPVEQPSTLSVEQSGKYRGMTPGGIKQSEALFARTAQQSDPTMARLQTDRDRDLSRSRQTAGVAAESVAEVALKEREHYAELGRIQDRIVDVHKTRLDMEKQAHARVQQESAGHIAAYKEQLAGVRNLAAQDPNPLRHLSGSQKAGLVGAAFAQGFLAPRGIQINVLGQIDAWVDREIQEHQRSIQNARAGAEDTLNLYNIARQTASDDYEARQRLTGMALEMMKTQTLAASMRFQSDVAVARAKGSVADIQAKQDEIERKIRDNFEKQRLDEEKARIDEAHKKGLVSIGWYEAKTKRIEEDRKAKEEDEKQYGSIAFIDPEGVTENGKYVYDAQGNQKFRKQYRVRRDIDPVLARDAAKDATTLTQNHAGALGATNNMIDLYNEATKIRSQHKLAKNAGWEALARVDSTGTVRRFLLAREDWAAARLKMFSGASATEQEAERHRGQAYLDQVFEFGSEKKGEAVYAGLRKMVNRDYNLRMQGNAMLEAVRQGDPDEYEYRPVTGQRLNAVDDATLIGEEAKPGYLADAEAKAEKGSPRGSTKPSEMWSDWVRVEGADYKAPNERSERGTGVERLVKVMLTPSDYSDEVQRLGSPEEVRAEAKQKLLEIEADGPADTKAYWSWIKGRMLADPKLVPIFGGKDAPPSEEDIRNTKLYQSLGN